MRSSLKLGLPERIGAERQRVDEVADDLSLTLMIPARHRGADDQVVLATLTAQQGLEGGQ